MGVLGEMFPSRKLQSEAGEAGAGQGWRLGRIDLDAGVVEVHRSEPDSAEPSSAGPTPRPAADLPDADVPPPAAPPAR